MAKEHLFVSSLKADHEYYRTRLFFADLLDLLLGLAIGWAVVRHFDWGDRWAFSALVIVGGWLAYGTVAGSFPQTLFRAVIGVRLVTREERWPGPIRALARAIALVPDHVLLWTSQTRSLDRLLGVKPLLASQSVPAWVGRILAQLPWLAAAVASTWLIVHPTRSEALRYLDHTLVGWHCCHGENGTRQCRNSLAELSRDASGQDAAAWKILTGCPSAKGL